MVNLEAPKANYVTATLRELGGHLVVSQLCSGCNVSPPFPLTAWKTLNIDDVLNTCNEQQYHLNYQSRAPTLTGTE